METAGKKNASKELIGILITFVVLIILFTTNPNENEFKDFLKRDLIEKGYKDGEASGTLMKIFARPTVWAINQTTERKTTIFFQFTQSMFLVMNTYILEY